jgi:hypothetical protein
MLLVFALTVYLDGVPTEPKTYWQDLNRCMYFAKTIRRQNYFPPNKKYNSPEVAAHCLPVYVSKDIRVWK